MKRTIALILVILLILTGLQAGTAKDTTHITKEIITFSSPSISENIVTTIYYPNADTWTTASGQAHLPIITETFTFPFGTNILDVDISYTDSVTKTLTSPIQQTPQPLHKNPIRNQKQKTFSPQIESSPDYYFTITSGRISTQPEIILTVYLYPIHYSEKILTINNAATITIHSEPPEQDISFPQTTDLLIISPSSFHNTIQPLVDHKIAYDINTTILDIEDILDSYPGRDPAEQLKYCIKDHLETTGIQYVLLFGGMDGQSRNWHIPVRYAHLDDQSNFETSFISDLYYADIYDGNSNFSDWDPDQNGIFAEWNDYAKDELDLVPDVSVGRLPCRNKQEAKIMVEKIITYETTAYGSNWFNKIVAVGGDSAPGYIFNEGEEENKQAIKYLPGFENVTLWTSDGTLTGPDDVVNAVSEGCGFLFFDGHGNPSTWSTHPPDNHTWITGLDNHDMPRLANGEKTPITVVGGCHNGQFNVTLRNIPHDWLRMIKKYVDEEGLIQGFIEGTQRYWRSRFYYMEWVPECWAWRLTRKIGGGGIAILAYTGLDWFAEGDYNGDGIPDCVQYYSGFANVNFFKNYGVNNITKLGLAHKQTLIDYIQAFPPMAERLDCKTVEEFTLLGDPSLQIGGYASS